MSSCTACLGLLVRPPPHLPQSRLGRSRGLGVFVLGELLQPGMVSEVPGLQLLRARSELRWIPHLCLKVTAAAVSNQ